MNKVIQLLGCMVVLMTIGCETTTPTECPSLSDSVTWMSYGGYQFDNEGRDITARNIVSDCGWHVQGGHNGGVGDTLQIATSNEAVIFVWADNIFLAFVISDGWEGQTGQGAYIGIHTTEFHVLHPEFVVESENTSSYQMDDIRVEATFNAGFLSSLEVGQFYRL